MPPNAPTVRMQFETSQEKAAEIRRLTESCGFESQKELFNTAVTLLKWALRHAQDGHSVAAIDEAQGKYFQLEMPFLQHATESRKRLSAHGD